MPNLTTSTRFVELTSVEQANLVGGKCSEHPKYAISCMIETRYHSDLIMQLARGRALSPDTDSYWHVARFTLCRRCLDDIEAGVLLGKILPTPNEETT